MIHKFFQMGQNIVLDVNSGAVHLMDEVAFRLLGFLSPPLTGSLPAAVYTVMPNFSNEEIDEAYGDLIALWEKGELFSEDHYDIFEDKLVPSPVKAICLNVSHDCNMRCVYCFAGKGDYNQGKMTMSAETGKRAIDYLIAHSGDRINLEVDFFGGEPLLAFDTVKAVVAYARKNEEKWRKEFRFTLTTNGLLLDEEISAYLNHEMSNVVLSIDGRKSVHDKVRRAADGSGCYDAILRNFQDLVARRRGQEYYVRGTFTRHNKDFGNDVMALYDLGFDQISIEPVVADLRKSFALREADLPEVFSEYERLSSLILSDHLRGGELNFFHFMVDLTQGPCAIKRLRGCGCGNEYLAVTPTGDIYPCHQFVGMDKWLMGNVHEGSFDFDMKKYFARSTIYQKSECMRCWARFYCSGGCGANNFRYEKNICKPHRLSCEMEKKRLECAIALSAAKAEMEEKV